MKVFVGDKKILEHTPKLIEVSNEKCILHIDTNGKPKLYSADCPHQHGTLKTWWPVAAPPEQGWGRRQTHGNT